MSTSLNGGLGSGTEASKVVDGVSGGMRFAKTKNSQSTVLCGSSLCKPHMSPFEQRLTAGNAPDALQPAECCKVLHDTWKPCVFTV